MPANNVLTTWTPEREMELVALWEQDNFSAQQIANKMGGVSRSAVLGKVFRLRLKKRPCRNAYYYNNSYERPAKSVIQGDRTIKRSRCKTVYPNRERKPRVRIPNPNAKPALINVVSVISGSFISIMRHRARAPEMTKPELRAMLAVAMANTARLQ